MTRQKGLSEEEIFYEEKSEIEKFLESKQLKIVFKRFKIDRFSPESKLFLIFAFTGFIFFILSIFFDIFWLISWIYVIISIFFLGYIFKKNGKYNVILVLGILFVIVFTQSIFGQALFISLHLTWGESGGSIEGVVSNLLQSLTPYLKEEYTSEEIHDLIKSGATLADFSDYFHGEYTYYWKSDAWFFGIDSNWHLQSEILQTLKECIELTDYTDEAAQPDTTGFINALERLKENPMQDIAQYTTTLIDVINWIVFLFIIGYGASTIGDAISFQWEKIAMKIGAIALAITIMTFIYSIFAIIEIPVRTVFDTIGAAWQTMLKNVGLATLDASNNVHVDGRSVVNGLVSWLPLIIPTIFLAFCLYYRNKDLDSILFSRQILAENTIEVRRSKFSVSIGVIIFAMGLYLAYYFLSTADPEIVINGYITLAFYLFAIVTLLFLGMKFLILNKLRDNYKILIDLLQWTFYGLLGLFLWFQIFQPAAYALNLTDTESSLSVLAQGSNMADNILSQLFLVAAPETLIFQVFAVGLGNRVYFYFRKTRISKDEEKRLRLRRWELAAKYRSIPLTESFSRENIRNIAKATLLKQKIDSLKLEIEKAKVQNVPVRFFILPTIISGLIGSFSFSWYHSFRRGVNFVDWWQNPFLGLTYFGAGFFLCFISFFSFPAAIFVHAFNNIIALILGG